MVYLFERSRNPEFLIGPGAITEVQIDRFNNYIFHVENEIDFRVEIVIENNGKKEYNQKDCNGLYLGT